jgi:glycosyltransferase involved in cell wall biosynthesis
MRIETKLEKEYKPTNKSILNITFYEKSFCSLRFTSIILLILFSIYIILNIYTQLITKSPFSILKTEINNDKTSEPREIIYQNYSLELDKNELKNIQNFIKNNKLLNPDETFNKYDNPKISIIIPVYNGEKTIEKSLLSIYNQNFKEIETIIIDDFSNDKSVEIINKLMKKFPSISLYQNQINKGLLYSKLTGILKAKGKYILFLYQNDFFTKKDAISILYEEVEKNNLDILGFSSLLNEGKYIHHFNEIENISQIMYNITTEGVRRTGDVIFNYFIKNDILKNILEQINEKYLEKITNYNSDFFLLYLISKNTAYNYKQIKDILYYSSRNWNKKWEESEINIRCLSYYNYLEFLYNKTDDNYDEKKIVIYELDNWIFNTKCRKNDIIRDDVSKLVKLLAEKQYVPNQNKKELFLFMFENVTVISSL